MRQDWRQTGGYSFPLPTFLVHRGILRSASLYTPPAFLCNIVQALFLTIFGGVPPKTFTLVQYTPQQGFIQRPRRFLGVLVHHLK